MYTAAWLAYITALTLCLAAGVIDWKTQRIPNALTYPAILAAWLYWPVVGWLVGGPSMAWSLGLASVFAAFAALIPYAILVTTAGLGGGDMKLMTVVGAWSASWQVVLGTTVYALMVAVVMALWVMWRRGVIRETLSRIFSAALLASSRVRPSFPEASPKVAFAVAVAVGFALAGAEQMLGLPTPWRALVP